MKKILVSTLLFLVYLVTQAQADQLFYKLKSDCLLDECNSSGATLGNPLVLLPAKSKFTIVGKTAAGVNIIKFWDWKLNETEKNTLTAALQPGAAAAVAGLIAPPTIAALPANSHLRKRLTFNLDASAIATPRQRYFLMSDATLEIFGTELVAIAVPSFGAVTLPFKYRPQGKDFTKDISITGMGGVKINVTKDLGLNFLIGIGIASVTLDKDNTEDIIQESTDRAAISFPFGMVVEWKRLQLGVFGGVDWLAKKDIDSWKYQGKPWVGLGIGLALFSAEDVEIKERQNTN